MGMVKDKDVKTVLSLMPVNATYYFTRAKIERAMDEKEFAKIGSLFNLKGKSYSDSTLALQAAKENAASDDLIFIGGSTYLVAEII